MDPYQYADAATLRNQAFNQELSADMFRDPRQGAPRRSASRHGEAPPPHYQGPVSPYGMGDRQPQQPRQPMHMGGAFENYEQVSTWMYRSTGRN